METQGVTEAAPPHGGVIATAEIDKPGDASTHFIFTHRLFTINNCRFAKNGADKMPCFYVPMGENQVAAIELAKLQQEFNIPPASVDAALLKKVERGLNYVREIRPNDSIPREVLDGSASWTVEDHHRQRAGIRMNMELIFWMTGTREEMDLKAMHVLQAEPHNKQCIAEAHAKLAQLLDVKDVQAVRQRIKEIVRETTYIEALRERGGKVAEIAHKLAAFAAAYKKDNAFLAEITRMQDLVRRAYKAVNERFQRADLGLREVVRAVHDQHIIIELVREVRDDVHIELKKWDEYFEIWSALKVERNEELEGMFRRFYRFLAENYMEQQAWAGLPTPGGKKETR